MNSVRNKIKDEIIIYSDSAHKSTFFLRMQIKNSIRNPIFYLIKNSIKDSINEQY